jgi:F1F0 ATPase subunit 2
MNEFLPLVVAAATGALLGAFFFGGLWWTIRRAISSDQPALWFCGSLLLRTSITLTGFYFVGQEYWERWLLCLLGFVLARLLAGWLTRLSGDNQSGPAQETSYAP